MQRLGEFLFGERRTPLRWLAIIPGLIALLFLGHAFEDSGVIAALPYLAIVFVSVAYVVRPRVILWVLLFGVFVFYTVLIDFMLIAPLPAVLMILAWPMKLNDS